MSADSKSNTKMEVEIQNTNLLWAKVNGVISAVLVATMLGIVGGQVWLHVKLNEDKLVTRQVDPQVNDATLDPEVTTVNDTNGTATTEEPLTAEDALSLEISLVQQELSYLKLGVFGCENPCTHEVVEEIHGQPRCVERKRVEVVSRMCPCFCGDGLEIVDEECVWYEGSTEDNCVEKRSQDPANHQCGESPVGASRVTDTLCNNKPCLINNVIQQTQDVEGAGSVSQFSYKVITIGQQTCDLGVLDLPDYEDRQQGAMDFYPLNMECNVCMLTAEETFAKLEVTIEGDDGWGAEYIGVQVNDNVMAYLNPEQLTDNNASQMYLPA